jgi:hypothetical protein
MIDIAAATSFDQATIFGGEGIADRLQNYGVQGYLVNLKDYMEYMPDVKAYLEKNANVAKAITAYDGKIYHLPYVAEIDNYARTFNGRPAWVIALLDSTDQLEKETHTLNVAYKGYWKRNSTNVVNLQNQAAKSGTLGQAAALKVLKDYIAVTYPDLAKPSDLYLGSGAKYDIDELIALWRVIELSPNTLSKVSTGKVVPNAEISPFFERVTKYREEILRLLNYFDGMKIFGSDSTAIGARVVADEQGNLKYTYADADVLEKIEYIKQWYDEGLIHSEFADLTVKDDVRKSMFFSDGVEGQRQFGFMTIDWIASTTAGSPKIEGILPPVTTISGAGINDFIHYMENTRAIKPDGWSISVKATEQERNSALALFNYMFTEEGNNVQVYSIPDVREPGGTFVAPDGKHYPKFTQWIFDASGEYKNGDVSGFLRDFMGSLLPMGYEKNIGFELQYTTDNGLAAWELYSKAGVKTLSYGADKAYMRMMPPIISLNEQDLAKIATTAVSEEQVEKMFVYIVGGDDAVSKASDLGQLYKDAGMDTYLDVYTKAYKRMMAE